MFKKFVAVLAMLFAAAAFAAVDVNKATQAELEGVKGIGPAISTLIVSERKKSEFKDWPDFVSRVKGVGDRSAANFSEAGLTVNGKAFVATSTADAPAKASVGAKAASGAAKVVEATKAAASTAASAVKTGAAKAASGVKGAAKVVKENAKDEKDAVKENVAEAKAKRDDKKAEKAMAASAPKK